MPAEPIKSRPDYGLDAPQVVRRFFLAGAAGVIGGLVLAKFAGHRSLWVSILVGTGIGGGICWIATAALMFFGSRVLKGPFKNNFRFWRERRRARCEARGGSIPHSRAVTDQQRSRWA